MDWTITPETLSYLDADNNQGRFNWSIIETVVRFDGGFVLFQHPRVYFTIPLRGFTCPRDSNRFAEYAQNAVKKYIDRRKNPNG